MDNNKMMKICDIHWNKMREAIEKYNLSQFVASDSNKLAEKIAKDEFEPLIGANNEIAQVALDFIGMNYEVWDKAGGCPICALGIYDWADGVVYQQVYRAEELGLLPKPEEV